MRRFDTQRGEYMALMRQIHLRDPDAYEAVRQEARDGGNRSRDRRWREDVN